MLNSLPGPLPGGFREAGRPPPPRGREPRGTGILLPDVFVCCFVLFCVVLCCFVLIGLRGGLPGGQIGVCLRQYGGFRGLSAYFPSWKYILAIFLGHMSA